MNSKVYVWILMVEDGTENLCGSGVPLATINIDWLYSPERSSAESVSLTEW